MDELNFTPENLSLYRRLYNYGSGIVLLTGPTGSGKTTTLYATLAELNSSERNIVTIEDPVEYRIKRHKPGCGKRKGRADFCKRAAQHFAAGPGYYYAW